MFFFTTKNPQFVFFSYCFNFPFCETMSHPSLYLHLTALLHAAQVVSFDRSGQTNWYIDLFGAVKRKMFSFYFNKQTVCVKQDGLS